MLFSRHTFRQVPRELFLGNAAGSSLDVVRKEPDPFRGGPAAAIRPKPKVKPRLSSAFRSILPLLRPPEQRADRAGHVEPALDQRLDAVRDRHLDAAPARHLRQRGRGEGALDEAPLARFLDAGAAAERKTEGEIARLPRGASEDKIAEPRKPHERRGAGAKSLSEPAQFRKAARDQRRPGACAESPSGSNAAGDREHVLGRAANLDAANVGRMVKAQVRPVQEPAERARERAVAGGERHRGRQAGRDVRGEGRARQDRAGTGGRGFGENLGHEGAGVALDSLGASDEGRGPVDPSKARGNVAGRLGGGRDKNRGATGERAEFAGGEDPIGEFHAGQLRRAPRRLHFRHPVRIAAPQHDIAAGGGGGVGERHAPRAGARHSNGLVAVQTRHCPDSGAGGPYIRAGENMRALAKSTLNAYLCRKPPGKGSPKDSEPMSEIDLPTVLLALAALFVAFKLRSVLGTRNSQERPANGLLAPLRRAPAPPAAPPPVEAQAPAIAQPRSWKGAAEPEAFGGLDAIAAADRTFDGAPFLSGARAAYVMVVHAFAAGDAATLKTLMAPEAFANFDSAIRARAAAGHATTTTVVSIDEAIITAARLMGSVAQVSVRFTTKLVSATKDKAGAVVDGSPTEVVDHVDVWTFERDVRSRDPNWRLTATQSEV